MFSQQNWSGRLWGFWVLGLFNGRFLYILLFNEHLFGKFVQWPIFRAYSKFWTCFKNPSKFGSSYVQKYHFDPKTGETECNLDFSLFPLVMDSFLSLLHLISQFTLFSFTIFLIFSIRLNSFFSFFLSFLPLASSSLIL